MPNRLALAASPYLRSHADNPIDWWPWGPEAFEEAVRRDVPVMVSIGYSTCHWCHVMARESFSDHEVAAIMNENLVAIKVDREEHAEVDATYLAAAGAFTQNLGWPLNVFVTPQGRAFYAGTYWPPEPVQGHPAFRTVLGAVIEAWRDRRAEAEGNGAAIVEALRRQQPPDEVTLELSAAVAELESYEDTEFGGFGGAPKFPVSPVIAFLQTQDGAGSALAQRTLEAMAASRLRDFDGGFFRYATRRDWTEPHYERMLYDNAQLLGAYARAGAVEVAEGVASFLITTLQLSHGGFASAQDSESIVDGRRVEGFYYTLDLPSRARLEPPALDRKVLTGWNGLAIEALALAGSLFDRPEWIAAARRAADFLLENHVRHERLVRVSIDGTLSDARATLEDYGMLAGGLLRLAIATGEARYAVVARDLIDAVLEADGVPDGQDPVLAAQGIRVSADDSDGAYPSGSSALAAAEHTLWLLTAHEPYRAAARDGVSRVSGAAQRQPLAHGAALAVAAGLAAVPRQVVVVTDEVRDAAASAARTWHRTGGLSLVVTSDQAAEWTARGFELLEGRVTRPGITTSYVCEEFVCQLPVTSVEELLTQLSS